MTSHLVFVRWPQKNLEIDIGSDSDFRANNHRRPQQSPPFFFLPYDIIYLPAPWPAAEAKDEWPGRTVSGVLTCANLGTMATQVRKEGGGGGGTC